MNEHAPHPRPVNYHEKIVTPDGLRDRLQKLRESKNGAGRPPVAVLCHGCFDIVHPGHIRYLQFARGQGDVLIVSITGDAAIEKGALRPYIPQELRAENLAALQFVDHVVIDPEPTACKLLQALRPDIYVKGHEYAASKDPRFLAERQVVESYGGRVIFSSGDVVFSSTRLVEASAAADDMELPRLGAVCRRHRIDLDTMHDLLNAIRGKRIVVIGDCVVHRYVLCDATDIASESPMMAVRELDQKDYLGGAGLVARQLAELGAETVLITSLGGDRPSQWVRSILEDARVAISDMSLKPFLPMATRYLVDEHKVFKVDRTVIRPLDSVDERLAAEAVFDEAAGADAAVFFDLGCGMITHGFLQRLGSTFRNQMPFIAGGAAEPQGSLKTLRFFDLLLTSERKLRTAASDRGSGISSLVYDLMQQTQARQTLVTLGKRGLVAFDRRSHDRASADWSDRLISEYFPTFAHRVTDRLGCAEIMLATAAAAACAGATLMQGGYLAQLAAARRIARLGPQPLSSDDLRLGLTYQPELQLDDAESGQAGAEDDAPLLQEGRHLRPLRVAPAGEQIARPRGAPQFQSTP